MAQFDVIIVGGGINGAAIARDGAMRGLNVLLLERDDFASGASGKNGRMIHGGLRYLEQREVRLVREALAERATLLKIAPHLVARRDLIIPIRSGVGRSWWMVRLGLWVLDILSGQRSTFHSYVGKAEALQRMPSLNPDGLRGAAVMFDAFSERAERLTLENVIAAACHGATLLNHTAVVRLIVENGAVRGVVYRAASGDEIEAHAPVIVNATGAWADEFLCQAAGINSQLLGPAKGTFVVIPSFEGAPQGSVFFEARADRRPIVITPWNGLYLVGTTDHRIDGAVDETTASKEEVEYLLAELALCFPSFKPDAANVLYTYTGVRPLPRAVGVSAKVPRKHIIHDHDLALKGLITILGGKLSTFRSLAEEVVDIILTKLGKPAVACLTAATPFPGGQDISFSDPQLREPTRLRLLSVYGSRAGDVLSLAQEHPDLFEVIDPETGAIAAEIVFAVQHEWARTFEDILVRRTLIGRNSQLGQNTLNKISEIAARHLGWDADRIASNRRAYQRYVELSRSFAQSPRHSARRAAATGIA